MPRKRALIVPHCVELAICSVLNGWPYGGEVFSKRNSILLVSLYRCAKLCDHDLYCDSRCFCVECRCTPTRLARVRWLLLSVVVIFEHKASRSEKHLVHSAFHRASIVSAEPCIEPYVVVIEKLV